MLSRVLRKAFERLRLFYATQAGGRFIRYTIVSAFNVAFSVFVLAIVFGVFRVWTEVPSTLFANIVAIPPGYYLTRTWAWGKSGRSHLLKEVVPFWVMTIAGVLLALATSDEARHIGLAHHLSRADRTGLLVVANLLAFGVVWIAKFFALNMLFRESTSSHSEDLGTETSTH
jgi:putative flippase GtrA